MKQRRQAGQKAAAGLAVFLIRKEWVKNTKDREFLLTERVAVCVAQFDALGKSRACFMRMFRLFFGGY